MSYLDRLKVRISEKSADPIATKATEGAFVPFVAPLSAPFRQIAATTVAKPRAIPPEIRLLIDRFMRLRDCSEENREAFAEDWRANPEVIERGLRHLVDFYGGKP
jgi:hypothetical protein